MSAWPWSAWLRRLRAARASTSGAAILEFALVLPLLMAVLAGTVELGRGLSTYLALEGAARSGARALARVQNPGCDPVCSPGAARAIDLARAEAVAATGLAAAAIQVSPHPAPPAGTVVMRAEARMPLAILGDLGLPQGWRIAVQHQEPRLEE